MPTLTIPEDTYRQLADKAVAEHTTVDALAAGLLADAIGPAAAPAGGVLDFLDGLPAVARTSDEWAEYDRVFLERRVEWL